MNGGTITFTLSALPDELLDAIAQRVAGRLSRPTAEPWIGVRQAAAHLDCKPHRVYDLVRRKDESRLPHRKDGSRLLFRRSELDAYLEG